jgi:hypothetical protein
LPEYVPISADGFQFFALSGAKLAVLRLIYVLAGLSSLYFVIAPAVSGVPDFKPVFVTTLFWCCAILFVVATFLAKRLLGYGLAVAAGLCIASLYFCEVLVRVGYFRLDHRLVALPHDIPRWRFTLDKPVFHLLLISTLISLVLSVLLLIVHARVKSHSEIRN